MGSEAFFFWWLAGDDHGRSGLVRIRGNDGDGDEEGAALPATFPLSPSHPLALSSSHPLILYGVL